MKRKMGLATHPRSVIVSVHAEPVDASGTIAIVHVPPNIFSRSVTRVTRRRGGSCSTMSTGTDEAAVARVTAAHTS